MKRRAFLMSTLLFIVLAVAACGGDPEPSPVPVDVDGFPIDWPIAIPPGTVNGCDNGTVMQENSFFSVVMCLPDDPDPFTASENYLATLEGNGFVEREPGAFHHHTRNVPRRQWHRNLLPTRRRRSNRGPDQTRLTFTQRLADYFARSVRKRLGFRRRRFRRPRSPLPREVHPGARVVQQR